MAFRAVIESNGESIVEAVPKSSEAQRIPHLAYLFSCLEVLAVAPSETVQAKFAELLPPLLDELPIARGACQRYL